MAIDETTYKPGDSDNNILRKILAVLAAGGGGGGGGGGGAVTIADGADVTLGAKADAASTNPLISGSAITWLKGILTQINAVRNDSLGKSTDATITNPAFDGSLISFLRGVLTAVNTTATNTTGVATQATLAALNTKIPASPSTDRTTAAAPFSVELSDGAAFYKTNTATQLPAALGQTTASASMSVVLASDQQTVGGFTQLIKDTTAVSTTPAYSAGDAIGAKRTLTGALRLSNGTALLESIQILDRANQKAGMNIIIFDSDPTNATITDNAAFVFSTDDLKVLATIPVATGNYITMNSKAVATLASLGVALKGANGNTNLYAVAVAVDTPTYAATTDLQIIFGFLQD